MSGLTSTKEHKHAAHVWRLVKRSRLGGHNGNDKWDVKWGCDKWEDFEPHPDDVVGLYKESLHSSALAQMPVVVLPARVAAGAICPRDLKVDPLKKLSDRDAKEF